MLPPWAVLRRSELFGTQLRVSLQGSAWAWKIQVGLGQLNYPTCRIRPCSAKSHGMWWRTSRQASGALGNASTYRNMTESFSQVKSQTARGKSDGLVVEPWRRDRRH